MGFPPAIHKINGKLHNTYTPAFTIFDKGITLKVSRPKQFQSLYNIYEQGTAF